MKIYTRGGDKGKTSLFTGERVEKSEARIEALGSMDELVAVLGLAKTAPGSDDEVNRQLGKLQTELYLAMADIAGEPASDGRLPADAVQLLEAQIDALDADLPELRDFLIPGETPASASLHFARTVCRRAERQVSQVARDHRIPPVIVAYLNRMADLLFTMARWVDREGATTGQTFKASL